MDIKETLLQIADMQANEMWTMIEWLPNRTYKSRSDQEKDLLELSRLIQAYIATKNAMQKA